MEKREVLKSKLKVLTLGERLSKLKEKAGMVVQSVLFSKDKFSVESAKAWAEKHGFVAHKVDVTDQFIRLRQKQPSRFKDFRTVIFTEGVKAVVAGNLKSKFAGSMSFNAISKFGADIKSDQDIQIPMRVEFKILKAGQNRDGFLTKEEMEQSASLWSDIPAIDFHDKTKEPTAHKITDRKGYTTGEARVTNINGEWWLVVPGEIFDRALAYQLYLRALRGKKLEISAEYGWNKSWNGGVLYQTDVTPYLISFVNKGHIDGNEVKIAAEGGN